jgi:hypothetical protein
MIGNLAQTRSIRTKGWGILVALAAGVLLGVLVSMPYEQFLGLSAVACTVLRSAVATAILSGLCTVRPKDLVFDVRALAHRTPAWTLDRLPDVLNVHHAHGGAQ